MTAVDRFTELEERITRTIQLVKATKDEKDALANQLESSRREIRKLEAELDELRRERDLIRAKVESLLGSLSELTEGALV